MTPEMFAEEIKAGLSKMLKIPVQNIKQSSLLKDDLGIDSVDWFDMAFMLEEKFNIKIEEHEAMKFKRVGDVIAIVFEKKGLSR